MPLIAKDNGGADFDPIPAGMHHGICYGIVDLGTQPSKNPAFKAKHQVCFTWELPGERYDYHPEEGGPAKNLPRAISSTFTLSLSPKSTLRPMLESWRGRKFTEQELDGFDLKKVLAANCLLNVIHEKKDGKTYANVKAVAPLLKGTQAKQPENPTLYFALDDQLQTGPLNFPSNMPDWLKKRILQSEEAVTRGKQPAPSQAPEPPSGSQPESLDDDGEAPF